MTPQEILKEIYNLPPTEQNEITDTLLKSRKENRQPKSEMSREEFLQSLYEKGLITHIPQNLEDDDNFEPIEIEGEPLSETIIRERR